MIGIFNKKPTKRLTAIILVIAIFCACVIGDNYLDRKKSGDLATAMPEVNQLKSVDELVLAETTTKTGKISEDLLTEYEKIEKVYNDGDKLDNEIEEFSALVLNSKDETMAELDKTDNGTEEYNDYRCHIQESYDALSECLSQFNEENADETLNKIKEMISPEKPFVALGDELPFENVSKDSFSIEKYATRKAVTYEPKNTEYSESNLKVTNDTIINENIRTEIQDLASPLEIYQYVKNNYIPEFYYGSRKGAIGTFEQKAGNDYDIASLLIGIFRDREIPARYVRGEIELTAEQAMKWTATDDINVALRLIASLGIPATGLTSGGDIIAVRMEHVWVEAYVPYTDYRGSGNKAGESFWIPLDPSFKEVTFLEGVNLSSLPDYVEDEKNYLTSNTEIYGVNLGELSSVVEGSNSAFVKYMVENGYGDATLTEAFGGREIAIEDLGYLPLSLPYIVNNIVDNYDDIPENLTDSITISLVGNSVFELEFNGKDSINKTLYAPDIYGKRIILTYTPATEDDIKILNKYGNMFSTPAYLLKLKPQLIIDGEVVAEGAVCNAGYMQKYNINIHNASERKNDANIGNAIVAGGIYCIALDYGTISANTLKNSANNMDALKQTASEANIYTDKVMGEMLNSVAKSYFAQLDMYNAIVAGQNNVTSTRDLSVGIVGFNINVLYAFGRPAELNEGGMFLDIGHDAHCVVSNENNDNDEKEYMLQSGIYASAMEHGVLEQITGIESVSTIKVLEYAKEKAIPIHAVAKENLADELGLLNVSEQVKQEIKSSVNAGKIVVIPEQEITLNQWSGIGYMVLDPDTFACGYMISGGLAGGAMTAGQVIEEYICYVVDGLFTVIMYELVKMLVLSCTTCGWVAALFVVIEVLMVVNLITEIVNLFIQYSETGNVYYLQEALIRIASALTVIVFVPKIKAGLEKLKNSLGDTISKLKQNSEYNKDVCFVEGTNILTSMGLIPIEKIKTGDFVQSFNPQTLEVSQKEVEETFVHETSELLHISIAGEKITTTPEHPFYVAQIGFVKAIKLRAGDILCTVNGEYVVVEKVQHEILESPIKVYNFRVADNHTYFVGNSKIGVHNAKCAQSESIKKAELSESDKAQLDDINKNPKYNVGEDRNIAKAEGEIGGEKVDLESISGRVVENSDGSNNKGNFTPANENHYRFIGKDGSNQTRYLDTEYKIIDFLYSKFKNNPNVFGKLKIISKNPVCQSCKSVIEQFSRDFPNIEIEIKAPMDE